MNPACPQCGYSWATNGFKNDEPPVPLYENGVRFNVGVIHFCSEKCRDRYEETSMFPEYYVSRPPEDVDDLAPVYYKVTGKDPDGHVFWMREGMKRPKEDTFYDLFMEAKNGFGVERVGRSETPWSE